MTVLAEEPNKKVQPKRSKQKTRAPVENVVLGMLSGVLRALTLACLPSNLARNQWYWICKMTSRLTVSGLF
jgi:hypothetical protein